MKKKNFPFTFEFDFYEQLLHRLTDELVDYLFGISFSEMLVKIIYSTWQTLSFYFWKEKH
jgi:hypothetical protein